jgi:hypothetical protein
MAASTRHIDTTCGQQQQQQQNRLQGGVSSDWQEAFHPQKRGGIAAKENADICDAIVHMFFSSALLAGVSLPAPHLHCGV